MESFSDPELPTTPETSLFLTAYMLTDLNVGFVRFQKQELNKVLFTNLYYHINITATLLVNVINFYIYIKSFRPKGLLR